MNVHEMHMEENN